jgi:hypothetical protein
VATLSILHLDQHETGAGVGRGPAYAFAWGPAWLELLAGEYPDVRPSEGIFMMVFRQIRVERPATLLCYLADTKG